MASLKQYRRGIYYYTKAALIYRALKRYLKNEFSQDLKFPNQVKKDYFYHSPYYNRTKQYMHANHFFGELLCLLRGKTIQADERMRFANLSSCAPIFDDFFEKETNLEHIHQLLKTPDPLDAKTDEEQLSVLFLNNILESLNKKNDFLNAAQNLFQAQMDSRTQIDKHLSIKELLNISLRKGGYSGLMYAHLLNEQKDEMFLEIAYDLGSFGQLMDDVFDIYDDAKDGIRTFANQSKSVDKIEEIINLHKKSILEKLEQLPPNKYQTHHFIRVFHIFSSTIELAIYQYKSIQTHKSISPNQCLNLSRKTWIVDMEKPANIWRLFYLSVQEL